MQHATCNKNDTKHKTLASVAGATVIRERITSEIFWRESAGIFRHLTIFISSLSSLLFRHTVYRMPYRTGTGTGLLHLVYCQLVPLGREMQQHQIERVTRRIIGTVLTRSRRRQSHHSVLNTSIRLLSSSSSSSSSSLVDMPSSSSIDVESSSSSSTPPNTTPLEDDNPCWGSPTQCDLKHLLSQFPKETTIVYESNHYVVLNKPPDLRMDGPYAATVHKLLTYWYPPPSLQCLTAKNNDDNELLLLQAVSKLHRHNSIADNALRPCHQLDYATSGLLCVARTQTAAAHAVRQWEDRQVTKEYLALVEGRSSLLLESSSSSSLSSMPRFSPTQIRGSLQHMEQAYKFSRRPTKRRDQQTFQGFQPAHAIFLKYKATILSNNKKNKKKRGRPELLTPEQWDTIWNPVQQAICEDETNEAKDDRTDAPANGPPATTSGGATTTTLQVLKDLGWKQLCRTNMKWKLVFQQAADIHNDLLRQALQKEEEEENENDDRAANGEVPSVLPTIFGETIEEEESSEKNPKPLVVYICCPLGQSTDPNDFSMKVPPDPELLEKYPHMKPFAGSPDLDYKPSLTKCTILSSTSTRSSKTSSSQHPDHAAEDGNDKQVTTTKVQLLPLTGRRHQLRAHMTLLVGGGYGILGDATYNRHVLSADRQGRTLNNEDSSQLEPPLTGSTTTHQQRMCLHSHKLSLRLLVNDQTNGSNDELIHLEAPDPF
jgi:23S rRNA-/tRNA-specific pseudouridylate synthase